MLSWLLEEKHAGNNSEMINEESVALFDKLLNYKCISTKQHKILLIEGLNEMKTMKLIEKFSSVIISDTV